MKPPVTPTLRRRWRKAAARWDCHDSMEEFMKPKTFLFVLLARRHRRDGRVVCRAAPACAGRRYGRPAAKFSITKARCTRGSSPTSRANARSAAWTWCRFMRALPQRTPASASNSTPTASDVADVQTATVERRPIRPHAARGWQHLGKLADGGRGSNSPPIPATWSVAENRPDH